MKIVFVFPGYAAQHIGMGKELYDEHRIVQEFFEEASSCLNSNSVKLVFSSSDAELAQMSNAYPMIFLLSSAITALLRQEGIVPTLVVGYNTGEYAALYAAQSITFCDGLYMLSKLALEYSQWLADQSVRIVEVTGIEHQELNSLCAESSQDDQCASIAIYESPHRAYVSGTIGAIERLTVLAKQCDGARVKQAPLEIGLHSRLMHPFVQSYTRYLAKIDYKHLATPMLSSATSQHITHGGEAKTALLASLEKPVLWDDMMVVLADADIIIQVGPGVHLATLMKEYYPEKATFAVNTPADVKVVKKFINSISMGRRA